MNSDDDESSSNNSHMDDDDVDTPTPNRLFQRHSFYRQTRKGKIFKTVHEHYLRDDLGFGNMYLANHDTTNNKSFSPAKNRQNEKIDRLVGHPTVVETVDELVSYLGGQSSADDNDNDGDLSQLSLVVVDTNAILHNFDVLEQISTLRSATTTIIVIPQTTLLETKANKLHSFERLANCMQLVIKDDKTKKSAATADHSGWMYFPDRHHTATATTSSDGGGFSSANDENDQRIRNVAKFYGHHLKKFKIPVILITDDANSRKIAKEEHSKYYTPKTVRQWVSDVQKVHPDCNLLDQVANFGVSGSDNHSSNDDATATMQWRPHVDGRDLVQGVANGQYYKGVYRCQRHDENGIVTIRQDSERVSVAIVDANRAVSGDLVAIQLEPLDKWQSPNTVSKPKKTETPVTEIAQETAEPSLQQLSNTAEGVAVDNESFLRPAGKVVGIIRRNFGSYAGSIFATTEGGAENSSLEQAEIANRVEQTHADGSCTLAFFAVDKSCPPILLRTHQRERLIGQRLIVAIDSWPLTSPYPLGHYVRTIGPLGDKNVETKVLLHEHDIPHEPFSAAVLACLPPADYKIKMELGRDDLRHIPVLSIDPPNCKDIDDALHCTLLENGNYQVGVHIADVTHYVKAGSAIDVEAANRSTSTYLVNQRLDMLPSLLTTDLCSLKGDVDRFAFSVLWEVTPDAEIVNVDFKKSIIHSIAALTYQQAQTMIDQPDDPDDIQACAVKRLAKLARLFRKRRIDAGALTLASPEVKFVLDSESLNPTDVQAYALLEANAVVEEFMLLANVTVSKKILRHYPTLSVLRRHPSPNRAMFDDLLSKARCRNYEIAIDDSKCLADSLDDAVDPNNPYINKLLRILSTRCMSPAQYFCSGEFRPTEWHHYGLAAPVYTHFTSPIRRYADVCVHRLLAAAIGVAPLPNHLSSRSYLHDLAANMNRRHRAAQMAGRASVQLHTLIFFAGEPKQEDAYVLGVDTNTDKAPTFTVMVPRYGIEGKVKLDLPADDPNLKRHPTEHKIEYTRDGTSRTLQVFDKVRVRIWVRQIADQQRELVVDLIEPTDSKGVKRQSSAGREKPIGKRRKGKSNR